MNLSPEPDACLLLLVRHGATDNNLARPPKIQGCGLDGPLSEQGRRQAEQTAQFLASTNLAAAYSSPLQRALQTAEIIAGPHQLSVETVDALREVDVGKWEGRSWDEISRTDPEEHQRFLSDPSQHGYLGGENLTQVVSRVAPALDAILASRLGQTILVVAHNVVNRVYLGRHLHVLPAQWRGIHQDNCGINVLRFRGGQVKPLMVNSAFHLQES